MSPIVSNRLPHLNAALRKTLRLCRRANGSNDVLRIYCLQQLVHDELAQLPGCSRYNDHLILRSASLAYSHENIG